MKRLIFSLLLFILVTGCSTMTPARYSISIDNNQELKKYDGRKVQIVTLIESENSDLHYLNCRLMGPIEASDGMTIPEFIKKAFNDEFKFANIYSEDGVKIKGNLKRIAFSSISGLTNGWWELELLLISSNGKSMKSFSRYEFRSGFDAITACNQTAQALGNAVQNLINVVVSDDLFEQLLDIK